MFGIGLRQPHYQEILSNKPALDFLEVHSENFFMAGGASLTVLEKIRTHYPISLHGVGLSIGSADQLCLNHLRKLRTLVERIDPIWISEHMCFGAIDQVHTNDLLPLAKNQETFTLLRQRIEQIQEYLGRPILVENVSAYLRYNHETMTEAEFLNLLASKTGCGLLLDINNLQVNALNFAEDARGIIAGIKPNYVKELHLAGHLVTPDVVIDHHGACVDQAVWDLYQFSQEQFGLKPTLIEWDTDIPSLAVLLQEAEIAREYSRQYFSRLNKKDSENVLY